MNADLQLALELADAADVITLSRFRALDLVVDTKPDLTPVSEADRAVEEAVRRRVEADRPDHAFLGEEFGATGDSPWRWIVDPIDGTKNYVRGIPVYATLIALMHEDSVEVGVVSAPALGRRWWAVQGEGAFADSKPIRVSQVADLGDAHLSITGLSETGEPLVALARKCWRTRGFGDFWSHVLVAEGAVDISVDGPGVTLWDMAAVAVIVEEAGGRFTDFGGVPRLDSGTGLSTNGLLHDEIVTFLAQSA